MSATRALDTIAAIATPAGRGGIGIIRISGALALSVMQTLFQSHRAHTIFSTHRLYYGLLVDEQGVILDEVMAVYMRAPHTYTCEEVVELHCHAAYPVQQAILRAVLGLGVRAADPGEFTKRAFLAGRIDLTRAEAVSELLMSKTEASAKLALGRLEGRLSRRLETIHQALVGLLAQLEVAIDFPDQVAEIIDYSALLSQLEQQVREPLAHLIMLADQGKVVREGVKVVLTGVPNVGKSSLLNALLREERALVTDEAGTTRDTIEEAIIIHDIPVRLVDTAGIRQPDGRVEALGVERARAQLEEAALVLLLLDASRPVNAQEQQLYRSLCHLPVLIVLNKTDLTEEITTEEVRAMLDSTQVVVAISARHEQGLDALKQQIQQQLLGDVEPLDFEQDCVPNLRQQAILRQAEAACVRLHETLLALLPLELAAVELQAALACLNDITGVTTPDDVLDAVFADFCLGK